jgi:hypothetical protein
VTWHKLALHNSWVTATSLGSTGTPSWAIQGGVVYLSGAIEGGTKTEFAVLPAAARPAHALDISVYTLTDTVGWMYINPSGAMSAHGPHSTGLTSLAGISYPARSLPSHKLTLKNGWKSSQTRRNTGNPSYDVSRGIVYLSGSLHGGTSLVFATLPKAARPANDLYITVYTWHGTTGTLFVSPRGVLKAYAGGTRSFTSLAGVSFPAASVTTNLLAMLSGWTAGCCGGGPASYVVRRGVVYLSGSLFQSPPGPFFFAALPENARPAHTLFFKVYTLNSSVGTVVVTVSGLLTAYSTPASNAQGYTSLAAISYPVNS